MAVEKKKTEGGQAGCTIFSIEGIVVPLRQTIHDLLKVVLTDNGLPFTMSFFSRCPETASPEPLIAAVLQNCQAGAAAQKKIAEAIRSGMENFWSGQTATTPGFDSLLKSLSSRGVKMAVVTALPADVADGIMARTGLRDAGALLVTFDKADKVFPSTDNWLRAVKQLGAHPMDSVALAATSATCKSALSAGLRCVAAPDALTSWQDFCGVDYQADSLSDSGIADCILQA